MTLNWRKIASSAFVAIIITLTVFLSARIGRQLNEAVKVSIGSSAAEAAYQLSERQMAQYALVRIASGENAWSMKKDVDGNAYLTGYAYSDGYLNYPGLGWSVNIRQPADEAFTSITQLKESMVLLVLVTSLLFGMMGWLIAKWFGGSTNNRPPTNVELLQSKVDVDILTYDYSSDWVLHDVLTGLPNKVAVDSFLKHAINKADQKGTTLSFLYLALDGLEYVNDSMGITFGDRLLQRVAFRLHKCTREQEIVARVGEAEFLIILKTSAIKPMQDAEVIGERIINAINTPFVMDGETAHIGCNVGAAVWWSEDSDPYVTLRLANEAMYTSKRNGKNQIIFETTLYN